MKLSEIEPVARVDAFEKKANFTNEVRYGGEPLYSAKGMREYAKAQVAEALKACLQIKIPGRCNGKTAMIAEQFKNIIDSIFEEDTKND